ncbi:hypothetical protein PR003_g12624 [Phytophthora rubi]|uniref:Integrase catalytic domain-containing protein n=1 Tax=Phytophthora rubi TaxID=129364 RepID=A0A6A4FJR6_9STRA|nr:hypothetical protein PR003_g12624 [Phytophthora rubi]
MLSLLKKDVAWNWRPKHQDAFDAVKNSLASPPVLMLPDTSRPFHVECDASDFAIGCARMQFDADSRERVVSYQSRQMKPAEKNYPVHDKELLAMCYALIKFRVYLLGEQTFAVYPDHASQRTAMKSSHLSQRMARWLSFFAEYNFVVHYKPSKNNILVDVLSRRPDYDPRRLTRHQDIPDDDDDADDCATCVTLGINATVSSPVLPLRQQTHTLAKLMRPARDAITHYDLDGDLLTYAIDTFDTLRVLVWCTTTMMHPQVVTSGARRSSQHSHCLKPAASKQAPLRPLPIATSACRSISMDKMVHLAPVAAEVTADVSAELFLDLVFRHHGLPESIVSDRDPRFTSAFWTRLYALLGTRLLMSTSAHPKTDGQTERVNRVLEDVLRSYATYFDSWSSFLPMAEFALNNATHASTELTSFFVNNARHPRVPALLAIRSSNAAAASTLGGGEGTDIEVGAGFERTPAAPVGQVQYSRRYSRGPRPSRRGIRGLLRS